MRTSRESITFATRRSWVRIPSSHNEAPIQTPTLMGVRLFSGSKSRAASRWSQASLVDGRGGFPRLSCEIAFGREKAPPVTDSFELGTPKGARTGTPAKAADSHQAKRCRGGNTRLGRATLDRRLFVPNP